MSLDEYQNKRNFSISLEPKGDVLEDIKRDRRMFVIHEHHARRLHWDLRLEIGGILRSWAIPKNPIDVNKGIKRLAIQVEDHPVEYAEFEGEIPPGMYGAGTVKIWDKGEFTLEEDIVNKLTFKLKGKIMSGQYALIYVPKMGENSWLFMKKKW